MNKKFLDDSGVLYFWQKIKNLFVAKEDGKGLSTNDYTTAEKDKLTGIAAGANKYTHPTGDGNSHVPATGTTSSGKVLKAGATANSAAWTVLTKSDVGLGNVDNTADSDKPVSTPQQEALDLKHDAADAFSGAYADLTGKPTIPTKTSQLINDSTYQTSAQVSASISAALEGIADIDFKVVTTLPATGIKGVIYLMANSGTSPNAYDEYIYVNGAFEKIGTTDVDLSGYLKDTDFVAITNAEIDAIVV